MASFPKRMLLSVTTILSLCLLVSCSSYKRFPTIVRHLASQGESCPQGYVPSQLFSMSYNYTCVTCGQTCCQQRKRWWRDSELVDKRIREGENAVRNEFPWSVAIFELDQGNFKFICGGALISDTAIATAAHCIVNKTLAGLRVTIGEEDIEVNESTGIRTRNFEALQDIVPRANVAMYMEAPRKGDTWIGIKILRKDLAVLSLRRPTNKPRLCLRRRSQRQADPQCFGIGHGVSVKGGRVKEYSSRLQKAKVVLDYGNQCLTDRIYNSGDMLCASNGREHTVSCSLDSGSPVFCRLRKDQCSSYYLAGIFSFSHRSSASRCDGTFTVLADLVSVSSGALSHFAAAEATHDDIQASYMLAPGAPACSSMTEVY